MVNAAKQTAGKVLRDGLMMKHSFSGDTHGHYLVCGVYLRELALSTHPVLIFGDH